MVVEAQCGPNWLAVKVTLMMQFAPAARFDPHVLFWLKSAALVPVNAMVLITTCEVPVLVTVSGSHRVRAPTNCGAKLRLGGERVRVSAPAG